MILLALVLIAWPFDAKEAFLDACDTVYQVVMPDKVERDKFCRCFQQELEKRAEWADLKHPDEKAQAAIAEAGRVCREE